MANQTEYSRFEQRLIIKFLVAGKYKPCEFYRKMSDIYVEAYLRQKCSRIG